MAKKFIHIESKDLSHSWTSCFSRAAEAYLNNHLAFGPGGRSHMRIGDDAVIVDRDEEALIVGINVHAGSPQPCKTFSADRLVQHATTIKALWHLDNTGRRHPCHDQVMASITNEVLSWKPE